MRGHRASLRAVAAFGFARVGRPLGSRPPSTGRGWPVACLPLAAIARSRCSSPRHVALPAAALPCGHTATAVASHCVAAIASSHTHNPFACLFRHIFYQPIMFFSHDKSTISIFSHDFSHQRTIMTCPAYDTATATGRTWPCPSSSPCHLLALCAHVLLGHEDCSARM